jgi:hypothetical protein
MFKETETVFTAIVSERKKFDNNFILGNISIKWF